MFNAPALTPNKDLLSDPPFNNDNLSNYNGDKSLVERFVDLNKNACLKYVAYVVEGYFNDCVM